MADLPYREIIGLASVGLSADKIAFLCGCDANKVGEVMERASALELDCSLSMGITNDELRAMVDPLPAPTHYPPDCKAIFEKIRREGARVKLTKNHAKRAWSEYLRTSQSSDLPPHSKQDFMEIYSEWHEEHHEGLKMRIRWTPGEVIQVDWAGKTVPIYGESGEETSAYLFVATSPYSHYAFARASLDMSMQSWLEHHRHMFEFFGGAPIFLMPDNLRTAITVNPEGTFVSNLFERQVNRQYQDLADYYGAIVVPTRSYSPKDKAAVENNVKLVVNNNLDLLRSSRFTSIDQLNHALGELIEEFNGKFSSRLGCSRRETFLREEAGCLAPLPEKPFTSVTWRGVEALSDATVCLRGVYYEVPERYASKKVRIRITDDFVDIFTSGRQRQKIAHHTRRPDGSDTFDGFTDFRPNRFKPLDEWASQNGREVMLDQWHPAKNEGLTPHDVVCRSLRQIWWKCPDCGYEWRETPRSRTSREWDDCLACAGIDLVPGRNDLAALYPGIAAEWHPAKNARLPSEVFPDQTLAAWWVGAECGHEWKESIAKRTESATGRLCPYCSGKEVLPGFNDIATLCPELAERWHSARNRERTPSRTSVYSTSRVYLWDEAFSEVLLESPRGWLRRNGYDDVLKPFDSLVADAETIDEAQGERCPASAFLDESRNRIRLVRYAYMWERGASLEDWCERFSRSDILEEWHPRKNGKLTPKDVPRSGSRIVWWQCEHGHEWRASISERTIENRGCSVCARVYRVVPGVNDLSSCKPKLLEWYSTRNDTPPERVSDRSWLRAWWECPNCGFEWQRPVNRIPGETLTCPACGEWVKGRKRGVLVQGVNDLASKGPIAACQWHPTKNGDLKPEDVFCKSGKKAWWVCEHGHEWQAAVSNRAAGNGCPYCSNKAVLPGFNDLATVRPDLAAQWHPKRNGTLEPSDVLSGTHDKVWWICERGHEWEASPHGRSGGDGCPYCANKKVLPGFNDLASQGPELAAQWHPMKNGNLMPNAVTIGSSRKVWWLGECGHEWSAEVYRRVHGSNCPYCANQKALPGFNDLASRYPSVTKCWHPEKNGNLEPQDVVFASKQVVWWLGECGHEWEDKIAKYTHAGHVTCPYCSHKEVLAGFNDLATTHPELAEEWHAHMNKRLKPKDVTARSGEIVWWTCPKGHMWEESVRNRALLNYRCHYCSGRKVPEMPARLGLPTDLPDKRRIGISLEEWCGNFDRHDLLRQWHPTKNDGLKPEDVFAQSHTAVWWRCDNGHEWEAAVKTRTASDAGCPYCSNQRVLKGFNDLASKEPDIAAQWHPEKNGELKPDEVVPGSTREVWWLGECGHEWQAVVYERSAGHGCPYCAGKKVLKGSNDLASQYLDVAAQWHPERNGSLKANDVLAHSNKKAWWLGKCGHEWEAVINSRTAGGNGCPYCSNIKLLPDFNDLATTHPQLAAQWHPTKNGDLNPSDVLTGTHAPAWWRCDLGHEWRVSVSARIEGTGCPYCANKKVLAGFNDLATTHPALAAEWHPSRNSDLTSDAVTAGSSKKVWWLGSCGHEWNASVSRRALRKTGCPYCSGRSVLAGFNDLASTHPRLAGEWHPSRNGDLHPDAVTPGSNKKVWWQCAFGHEWDAVIHSRTKGAGCPHCYREWRQGSSKS